MGVLQGIAAGALLVMKISSQAIAGSSVMRQASRPSAWQTARAAVADYSADVVTAASIGTGLAAMLAAWWAA